MHMAGGGAEVWDDAEDGKLPEGDYWVPTTESRGWVQANRKA